MRFPKPLAERSRIGVTAPSSGMSSPVHEARLDLVLGQLRARGYAICVAVMAIALAGSAIAPRDWFTWVLETVPVMVGIALLWTTRARFPLTSVLYGLIAVHAVVLCVGGHYTYAEVPLGFWVQDALGLARNHYDRLGHFLQGFEPAILARELLLRRSPLVRGKWLFFIVTSICLAFSALYELIEWWTALATGASAEAFLGTQGDVWDPQWDMAMALSGALLAQLVLARVHDRQLAALSAGRQPGDDSGAVTTLTGST